MEDVTYRDVEFPEGTVVLVSAFTGNREGTAEGFDITADRTGAKPLTFGAGVHYCLGANLARAEMQEALAFLAPRMPGLALDGEPVYGSIDGIYGLDALPDPLGRLTQALRRSAMIAMSSCGEPGGGLSAASRWSVSASTLPSKPSAAVRRRSRLSSIGSRRRSTSPSV